MKTNKPLLGEERVRKKDRDEKKGQKEGGKTLQKKKAERE